MSQVVIARRRAFQRVHPSGGNFTPQGAAHNYQIEVSLRGALDPESGMILNIRDIDSLLDEVLLGRFDDLHTTETLAQYLFLKLQAPAQARSAELCKLRLYESQDFWVDVWP